MPDTVAATRNDVAAAADRAARVCLDDLRADPDDHEWRHVELAPAIVIDHGSHVRWAVPYRSLHDPPGTFMSGQAVPFDVETVT